MGQASNGFLLDQHRLLAGRLVLKGLGAWGGVGKGTSDPLSRLYASAMIHKGSVSSSIRLLDCLRSLRLETRCLLYKYFL